MTPPLVPRRMGLLALAVGLVVVGAVMTLAGDLVYQNEGLSWAGTIVALAGGVGYAALRLLGRRGRGGADR